MSEVFHLSVSKKNYIDLTEEEKDVVVAIEEENLVTNFVLHLHGDFTFLACFRPGKGENKGLSYRTELNITCLDSSCETDLTFDGM